MRIDIASFNKYRRVNGTFIWQQIVLNDTLKETNNRCYELNIVDLGKNKNLKEMTYKCNKNNSFANTNTSKNNQPISGTW